MKKLSLFLILVYSIQGFAAGTSHEIAKILVLTDACAEVNRKLSRLSSYSNPDPGKAFFKKSYLKSHEEYKATLAAVKTSPTIKELVKLNLMNESQAQEFVSQCTTKYVTPKTAAQEFRTYAPSNELSIAQLEQQNRYVLNIQSKKSEVTLDLDKHLENLANARNFSILVGEDTYQTTNVGKVLSRNFNDWGFIFSNEWSSMVVKVIGKRHYKQFFILLSNGKKAQLKESAFASALAATQSDFGARLVHQRILGQDRFEVLPETLTKSQIVSSLPVTRYYAKIKIQNSSFNFNFDEDMANLATINEIEVEVPKSTYDSKRTAFNPSVDLAALIFNDRFNVISGQIVKKTTAADPKWMEVKLKNGRTLVLAREAISQLP